MTTSEEAPIRYGYATKLTVNNAKRDFHYRWFRIENTQKAKQVGYVHCKLEDNEYTGISTPTGADTKDQDGNVYLQSNEDRLYLMKIPTAKYKAMRLEGSNYLDQEISQIRASNKAPAPFLQRRNA